MIRRLQKRLLLASMLSLFLVLCILIGTASAMNYHKLIRNADDTLQILRENGGRFPSPPGKDSASEQHLFRERPFESRYFLVVFRSDGTAEQRSSFWTASGVWRISGISSAISCWSASRE